MRTRLMGTALIEMFGGWPFDNEKVVVSKVDFFFLSNVVKDMGGRHSVPIVRRKKKAGMADPCNDETRRRNADNRRLLRPALYTSPRVRWPMTQGQASGRRRSILGIYLILSLSLLPCLSSISKVNINGLQAQGQGPNNSHTVMSQCDNVEFEFAGVILILA